MMKLYNQKNVIVYTTIQFYRWDRLGYLNDLHAKCKADKFKIGIKLLEEPIWKRNELWLLK